MRKRERKIIKTVPVHVTLFFYICTARVFKNEEGILQPAYPKGANMLQARFLFLLVFHNA